MLEDMQVTHIRLKFPRITKEWLENELKSANMAYIERCREKALESGTLVTSPRITLEMNTDGLNNARFVNLYLNGKFYGSSNLHPHSFTINTSMLPQGENYAEFQAMDGSGAVIHRMKKSFFIFRGEN